MRLSYFIAAFYYFVITVGFSITFHFCKGELTCFSFISEKNLCCHVNSNEQDEHDHNESTLCTDNCCSTESINITLDSDYTIYESDLIPNNAFSPSAEKGLYENIFIDSRSAYSHLSARGSPAKDPLYLMYSSFVFYG